MNGLREGMVLEQVSSQHAVHRLEELLQGDWCKLSAPEILREVHNLCDPIAPGHTAVKDVTLAFRGRFEALSKPDEMLDPFVLTKAIDVKTVASDATPLHSGTPPTTSRPQSHRKELEDRILRKLGPLTKEQQEQERHKLTLMKMSALKRKAEQEGLHLGSYHSPVRANSAALHPSKRALRR